MRNRVGFTLIELLVVIAIIALLLAILMPSMSRVRKQSRAVVCMANLKQWGLIFTMYTDDYNGLFQKGWIGQANGSLWWMDAGRLYYKMGDFRCCPEATKPYSEGGRTPFGAWGRSTGDFLTKGDFGSYGINGWVENRTPADGTSPENYRRRWKTPQVRGAAEVPLLLDNAWIDGWPSPNNAPLAQETLAWQGQSNMARFCVNRHTGNVNSVFLDWSVKKIGLKELWTLKWHREYDIAGPWTKLGGATSGDWPEWMTSFKDY